MKYFPTFFRCFAPGILLILAPLFSQPDTLTIIHINDSHSNLLPYAAGEYGGMARATSIIGMWRQTEPNPILLHAGDLMVGTLMFNAYFGVPELQLLQSLGCDAMVLGNHEFDAGPADLGNILAMAQLDPSFEIICSNAVNLDSVPVLDAIVQPYSIEQRGNVKVGIIGLTTPATNVISNPAPVVLSEDLVQMTLQTAAQLQAQGCQVILVLSHLGFPLDMEAAQYLSGVDAIIGGHTHTQLEQIVYVNGIPIVQAGEFYHWVGKLRLVYDGSSTSVLDYTLQEITPAIPAEPTVEATIEMLRQGIIAQYGPVFGDPYQQISYSPTMLNAYPRAFDTLDTPMGNLFTTAMLEYAGNADCALEPNGHIVEELFPGPVTPAELFRAYPYGYDSNDGLGFRLATYSLYGAEIMGVMEALLGLIDPATQSWDFLLQSSGLCFTIDSTVRGLQLGQVLINDQPINRAAVYNVVSSNRVVGYLQDPFGVSPANLTIHPVSVFQVATEFVAAIDTLNFCSTGCNVVTGIGFNQFTGIIKNFELKQNYPNPFNPETTIPFTLSRNNYVVLEVYDILGRKIRTLVNAQLSAGDYKFTWNSRDDRGQLVASGIYFYRITAGDKRAVKRMTLTR
jgi:5'-nucleotidase